MMMSSASRRRASVIAGFAAFASIGLASVSAMADDTEAAAAEKAASASKEEWPCINRKVPELSPAMIWDGPAITDTKSWRNDDAIRKLSQYLISRRVKPDEVDAAIKKFAAGLPADQHDAKLTELFAAVLTRTNEDRKVVMHGIEKMHKRQVERSKEIQQEALTLQPEEQAAAESPTEEAGVAGQASDAQEKYKWEVRAFQEKQANIPIACEIPQLIDERAGEIARAIRAEMKS
jgi:hypothetical protein